MTRLGDFRDRTPDRYVSGFGGVQHVIYQPVGTPRPRENCQPFTFELRGTNVKGQEKFVQGLDKLRRAEVREAKKRAKVAA